MNITYLNIVAIILTTLSISTNASNIPVKLTGVGATFPEPIYAKWADSYEKETGNKINYQGIGSSGGIKQIIANIVDFGASDIPLSDKRLNQEELFQFPTVIGGVVLVVNLPGIDSCQLVLDGKTLGNIYLGRIKKWNDEAIVKLNPNIKLTSQNIIVVHRADSSGTSFIFTNYLTKTNEEWKSKIGAHSVVNWPIGLGGKGNDGIAAFVKRITGSIGYVEYAYVKQNNLIYTKLISADGKPVSPFEKNLINAVKKVHWDKSLAQDLIYKKGKNTWPITSITFILLRKHQKKHEHGAEVLKFFDWAYKNGNKQANDLNYVTLPNSVIKQIRNAWRTNLKDSIGNSLY